MVSSFFLQIFKNSLLMLDKGEPVIRSLFIYLEEFIWERREAAISQLYHLDGKRLKVGNTAHDLS